MNNFEIIHFSIGNLKLQEPMSLITNWLLAAFCFFAVYKIKWNDSQALKYFRLFFIFFGISMIFSGLGHALLYYFGIFGKYPAWIIGSIAGYYIGKGVLFYWKDKKSYTFLNVFLIVKSVILLTLSLSTSKFLYVAIDTTVTYLLYAGFISFRLWMNEKIEMKFFVYGIIFLFPSIFIFLMNINIHRYLNRDDLSHFLMIICMVFFFKGVYRINLSLKKQNLS